MGVEEHKAAAAAQVGGLRFAVITLSDTRTIETDESGRMIKELLVAAGHQAADHLVIKDEPWPLRAEVCRLVAAGEVDFIVTTGGTGISPRDQTIEALRPLFDKELTGFGDLFRALSHQEVGSAALLSRATAGTAGRVIIFCLPGSRNAVRLATEALIVPEIRHLVNILRKA